MLKQKATLGLEQVLELNDGPWRWWVGMQAGLAMGVPLGLFSVLGYPLQGLMASLGAFTGLFCAAMARKHRARVLPFLAVGFVAAAFLGVICAGNAWLNFAFLVAVSGAASVLALGYGIGPPGPLMFVLVYAISGRIYLRQHLHQEQLGLFYLPLLVLAGAVLAYVVVISPLISPTVRRRETSAGDLQAPRSFALTPEAGWVTVRIVAGAVVAALAGMALGIDRTYWVVISALAVL